VSNEEAAPGTPLIINNWTDGTVTKPMNLLAFVPVTRRFRVPPATHGTGATHGAHATSLIPANVTQLVVVLSSGFSDWHARVQRYERAQGAPFRRVGPALNAVLGAAGYGWGDGVHGQGAPAGRAGPRKREGDLRSPAGLFRLGTVHGYGQPPALQLAYRESDETQRCVDDANSSHYNQVDSTADVGETWRSAEHMRRSDDMYELALDLEHNKTPIVPGHGSCIFVHAWAGPNVPVTGCTALAKSDLRNLLTWLKPGALWLALPEPEYRALRRTWGLP
jgi:L,D-peptidoglycan transpeptidase YkuD (ErfK/YbiS/YcfS/YnhG family)